MALRLAVCRPRSSCCVVACGGGDADPQDMGYVFPTGTMFLAQGTQHGIQQQAPRQAGNAQRY